MKKAFLWIVSILILLVVFVGGVFVGNIYEFDLDPLCPTEPTLSVTTEDLDSDNIHIKKGTLVALRRCEYADRFSVMFYVPNKLEADLFESFTPRTDEEKSDLEKMGTSMAQYGLKIHSEGND